MIHLTRVRTLRSLLLTTALGLSAPAALAQEPALAVVEKKASQLAFYNSSGERVAGIPVGETPHEIVRDPNGRYLYVTDNGVVTRWEDDPALIELRSHRLITIQIGTQLSELPNFVWTGT